VIPKIFYKYNKTQWKVKLEKSRTTYTINKITSVKERSAKFTKEKMKLTTKQLQ